MFRSQSELEGDCLTLGTMERIVLSNRTTPIHLGHVRTEHNMDRELIQFAESRSGPSTDSSTENFFNNPWFERVWIIQEVSLAQQAYCYIGEHCIDWTTLCRVALWLYHRRYNRSKYLGHRCARIGNAANMFEYAVADSQGSLYTMEKLLVLAQEFKATEPRDMIYGLLGLALLAKHEDLIPDYSKPLQEVYTQATRLAIDEAGQLSLLQFAHYFGSPRIGRSYLSRYSQPIDYLGWPSWVPVWNERYFVSWTPSHLPSFYRVDDDIALVLEARPISTKSLQLQGVLFDRVAAVSEVIEYKEFEWLPGQTLGIVRSLWSLVTGDLPRDHERKNRRSFAMCLVVAADRNGNPVDPEMCEVNLNLLMPPRSDDDRDELGPSSAVVEKARKLEEARKNEGNSKAYLNRFQVTAMRRRFFTTISGNMGWGPRDMEPGDSVCILFGSKVPFVLRDEGESWTLIGPCYVQDIMQVSSFESGPLNNAEARTQGEYIQEVRRNGQLDAQSRRFDIV